MCRIDWDIVVKLLAILLAWPPIALVISVIALIAFRKQISALLTRVEGLEAFGSKVKVAAAAELQQSAQPEKPALTTANQNAVDVEPDAVVTADPVAPAPVPSLDENSSDSSEFPQLGDIAVQALDAAAIEAIRENPAQAYSDYQDILFKYNAERFFSVAFGTQLKLLSRAAKVPGRVISREIAYTWFRRHLQRGGDAATTFSEFVGLLIRFSLLEKTDGGYLATELGMRTMAYIQDGYPDLWSSKAG